MTDILRRYAPSCYFVAFLFIVGPIVDVSTNIYPWDTASMQWRFGGVGVLSNYLVSVVFGLLLAGLVAGARESRNSLLAVGVFSGLWALLLIVLVIAYPLDAFQLRPVVREEQLTLFKIGAVKTLFKVLLSLMAFLVLTNSAIRAALDLSGSRKVPLVRA